MPNLAIEDLTPQQEADFRNAIGINAATVPNTPAGNIAATTVQAAINELDTEKAPASGISPAAISGTAVVNADARLTDERVPTAAGLTTKFATVKATLVDADRMAIFDSAASFVPKHSLFSLVKSTLKTYFDTIYAAAASYARTDIGQTFAGAQSFTGQMSSSGSTSTGSSTNLLNMATNDVRYAAKPLFASLSANVDIVSNATPAACGVSVVVTAGTYRIVTKAFCQVIAGGATAGGCAMELSGVTFSNIGGFYGKRASHGSLVLEYALGVNSTAPGLGVAAYTGGSDFSDSNWYTSNFGGVWIYLDLVAVLTAGTVEMKISQFTSHPTLTRFRANNTFMQLEKLS